MTLVVGVDACRGGWIAIVLNDGRFADSVFSPTFAGLVERFADAAAIGVDIPIGVPTDGTRAADAEARAFVGPRRSSVFATPPRVALAAATYAEARAVAPSLSAQSFALRKKILEVEATLANERVFEVHPEVSFAALNGGGHLQHSKRTWNGQMERRRLLARKGVVLPDKIEAERAAVDDVLDAAVAAWSAVRKAHGKAKSLPADPPMEDGRIIAIWY